MCARRLAALDDLDGDNLPELMAFAAYNDEWPLPAGAEQRLIAYNLFHLLNHANLFGGSYVDQSRRSVEALLRLL